MAQTNDDAVIQTGVQHHTDFLNEFRDRVRSRDLAVILSVPVILLVVFGLPQPLKERLVLAYTEPTLVTAFTAHFVHFGTTHLVSNLLAYVFLIPLVYLLSVFSRRRTNFHIAFVTFLIVFPLVISGLNVVLVRPRIGFGFSAINMAFFGFLPLALVGYLEVQFNGEFDRDHSPLLFFVGAAMISLLAVPMSPVNIIVAIVAVLVGALYLRSLLSDLPDPTLGRLRKAMNRSGYFESVIAGLYLFVAFPFAAFPADPVGNGAILNLYSHLLGYCLGYIVPYITFWLVRTDA